MAGSCLGVEFAPAAGAPSPPEGQAAALRITPAPAAMGRQPFLPYPTFACAGKCCEAAVPRSASLVVSRCL